MKAQQRIPAPARAAVLIWALTAGPALAYVGPGLGLATIGAILGAIAAVLLAIVGVFWYPIRSMIRKRRGAAEDTDTKSTPDAPE